MFIKGHIPWNKGKKFNIKVKRKMSEAKLKNPTKYWLGKKRDFQTKQKISQTIKISGQRLGKNNPMYKDGGSLKICPICKKYFLVPTSTKFWRKFCSYRCKSKWMRISLIGSDNSNWKGGFVPIYKYMRNWQILKEWRNKIFTRDNYICQLCGKTDCYLEAHHIKSFTYYPKLRTEITNGISLCRDCHNLTKRKYV